MGLIPGMLKGIVLTPKLADYPVGNWCPDGCKPVFGFRFLCPTQSEEKLARGLAVATPWKRNRLATESGTTSETLGAPQLASPNQVASAQAKVKPGPNDLRKGRQRGSAKPAQE